MLHSSLLCSALSLHGPCARAARSAAVDVLLHGIEFRPWVQKRPPLVSSIPENRLRRRMGEIAARVRLRMGPWATGYGRRTTTALLFLPAAGNIFGAANLRVGKWGEHRSEYVGLVPFHERYRSIIHGGQGLKEMPY